MRYHARLQNPMNTTIILLLHAPAFGAKLTPVGGETQFSVQASVSLGVAGVRYDNTGTPVENFDREDTDTENDTGPSFSLKQALVMFADNVEDSWTETYGVFNASIYVNAVKNFETTWYSSSGGMEESAGGIIIGPGPAPSDDWIDNYANRVFFSAYSYCQATARWPSWRKTYLDLDDTTAHIQNNDTITGLNMDADVDFSGGSVQYVIEPMLLEQAGDTVELVIQNSAPVLNEYMHDYVAGFDVTRNSSSSIAINGTAQSVAPGQSLTVNAQIGDILTLANSAHLQSMINNYRIPAPDAPGSTQDYRMHSADIRKNIIITVAAAAGTSADNPFVASAANGTTVFPAVPIEANGPGIDAPVWYQTPECAQLEITATGAALQGVHMPGEGGGGFIIPTQSGLHSGSDFEDADGIELWYFDGTDWVQHPVCPLLTGFDVVLPPGTTRIRLKDIDREALEPENNIFPVGLKFDGATTGVSITMDPLETAGIVPIQAIQLLLLDN